VKCNIYYVLQEFRAGITTFTNGYEPIFTQPSYNITLPVPLPAGYTIVGECGAVEIEAEDFDYHNQYRSNVTFILGDEEAKYLQVSSVKSDGKRWAVNLETTETFRDEQPLTFVLTACVSLFLCCAI
jgi:hypothetical protein